MIGAVGARAGEAAAQIALAHEGAAMEFDARIANLLQSLEGGGQRLIGALGERAEDAAARVSESHEAFARDLEERLDRLVLGFDDGSRRALAAIGEGARCLLGADRRHP